MSEYGFGTIPNALLDLKDSRIAALEAVIVTANQLLIAANEATKQAEAARDALRDAIVDYANGDSEVHPIVALSKLVDVVEREGGK